MKKSVFYLFMPFFAACAPGDPSNQVQSGEAEYRLYWQRNDSLFRSASSPLTDSAKFNFDSIARFAYAEEFRVEARYTPLHTDEKVQMATTTGRMRTMELAGHLEFEMNDKIQHLPLYRFLPSPKMPMKSTPFFLPFTDLSNGTTTYEGGRYLELSPAEVKGDLVTLDFNLAYNPYCVYNAKYSCPIPPTENHINAAVSAGAKNPKK